MPTSTGGSTWSLFSPTGNAGLDALLQGSRWGPVALSGSLNISYSFPAGGSSWSTDINSGYGSSSGSEEPWNNFHALTATDQAQVRKIFAMISTFTKLTFTELTESSTLVGDVRLAYSGAVSNSAAAHAYGPSGSYNTSTLEGSSYAYAGDVWINSDDYGSFAPTAGTYDYLTLIHEIGHALGLKHTFETDYDIYNHPFNAITPSLDSYDFSVMSYSAVAGDQNSTMAAGQYPTTLMSYDVYALQYLYGKNTSYNAGNTTYTFSAGKNYNQVIWDAGGNDTIVYAEPSTSVCRINLTAGSWQDLGNTLTYYSNGSSSTSVYNVQILSGVTIENATGGGGGDTLSGNSVANQLTGNGGNDTLSGGAGNDTLNGGSGNDSMTGGTGSDTYYVNSSADQVIETDASSSGGSDLVLSYLASYTLGANVENGRVVATGTASLTGNGLNNLLYAGSGNNVLAGGTGIDTVSYGYAAAAVTINLATTALQATGGSGSDTLSAIEGVYGSNYNDTLSGGSVANLLYGAAGNDRLSAVAGNDTLRGGAGNDTLTGGSGADCFRFDYALNASTNKDSITDFAAVDDVIQLENAVFTKLTTTGTLSAYCLRAGNGVSTAGDGNDYLIYNKTTGYLYYDADGNGAAYAPTLFVVLAAGAALTSADLVVT